MDVVVVLILVGHYVKQKFFYLFEFEADFL